VYILAGKYCIEIHDKSLLMHVVRALVKPLIEGLGGTAVYESFATYQQALEAYFTARDKGYLQVFRLPGDTIEKWGHTDGAEDL
jgi:hypothetical protein